MRLDLSVLNPEQRQAVTAGAGPLLVLAGAGSGKTRVITYRIAHLIQQGTPGDRVLGITFTNKAAREMRSRLSAMYPDLDPYPWLSTFHSLGFRILRAEYFRLGFRKNFPIYDDADARALLTEEMREIVGMSQAEKNLDHARREISHWKGRFVSPQEALDTADDDTTYLRARIYARYQDRLDGLNAVDFDDLIYRPVRLIHDDPEVRETWSNRFHCVLVDEYQDSNTAQFEFARLLAGPTQNLTVVGDDDQSIYAFRGAEVEKILSFRRDFPKATIVTLESNYRSVATILDAAGAVVANNSRRHPKSMRSVRGAGRPIQYLTLEDEAAEAEEAVSLVMTARRRRNIPYREQAILVRSAIQARPIEEKLRFFEVPYTVIGARSFFDRREVRDLLAYLRVLVLPTDDIATLRILNTPKRGIGKGSRDKIDAFARGLGIGVFEALARVDEIAGVSGAAKAGAYAFVEAVERARPQLGGSGPEALKTLVDEVHYDHAIREWSKDSQEYDARRRAIDSVLESVRRYEEKNGGGRLLDYLSGLSLDSSDDDDDEQDTLTLLTCHGAKGLEFRQVVLIGVEDELIPHRKSLKEGGDRALEEERRLFYVAMTRAKDDLVMTRAVLRRQFGKVRDTEESRFVCEIPESLIERREVGRNDGEELDAESAAQMLAEMRAKFAR